jgi:hypothetical protein
MIIPIGGTNIPPMPMIVLADHTQVSKLIKDTRLTIHPYIPNINILNIATIVPIAVLSLIVSSPSNL